MAPHYRHRHYYSLVFIFIAFMVGGVIIFAAQSITKRNLNTGTGASENRNRTVLPTPTSLPTTLPSGKPEILGASTSRDFTYTMSAQNQSISKTHFLLLLTLFGMGVALLGYAILHFRDPHHQG